VRPGRRIEAGRAALVGSGGDLPPAAARRRGVTDAPQRAALPTHHELRRTINDRETMLADPTLTDVIRVRAERTLSSTVAILDLSEGDPAREAAARTVAWLAESVGAYVRLPAAFAQAHAPGGRDAQLLGLADQLDLRGLSLGHVYDSRSRSDEESLARQLDVLAERFPADTAPRNLVQTPIGRQHLDDDAVRSNGLDVGDDGIP